IVDAPGGWSEEVGYGATEVGKPPFVVVTSTPPQTVRLDLDWTFVTTGLADAVAVARGRAEAESAAHGADLDVVLMGGGATVGSAVAAGLVDVLSVHLAPVILGSGTPLFTGGPARTLVQREVLVTTTATHLVYELTCPRTGPGPSSCSARSCSSPGPEVFHARRHPWHSGHLSLWWGCVPPSSGTGGAIPAGGGWRRSASSDHRARRWSRASSRPALAPSRPPWRPLPPARTA